MPGKGWVKNKMILIMEKFKELSFEEKIMVKGGGFWAPLAVGLICVAVGAVLTDWDGFTKGLSGVKN